MQHAVDKYGADDPAVDGLDMTKEMKSATFLGKFMGADKPTRDLAASTAKQAMGRATRAPGSIPMIKFVVTLVLGLFASVALVSGSSAQAVCKYSDPNRDDGCARTAAASGAMASAHQFPALLDRYGGNRPKWNVAGVDYPVGQPVNAVLVDPAKGPWPAGCKFGGNTLTCDGSNITIKGFDFSLGGRQLMITGGNGVVVTGNKFALTATCIDPLLRFNLAANAKMTVSYNDFEGAGSLCPDLKFGTLINGQPYGDKSTLTLTYNYFHAVPTDISENQGPSAGAAKIIMGYNYVDTQGFTSHPDGVQFNRGNFDGSVFTFNTYYNPAGSNTVAGTQPFHVEAQLTASISNSIVAFNTVVAPGTCNGGRDWPKGCSINFAVSCKNDQGNGWVDSNTGFKAYGNYIDWSGAIRALSNDYGCPGAMFGKPNPDNIDLKTGKVLLP